ncbi:coiled-coil domain-containing protein 25-like [Corticium candelabrum]|uniref:coiled-coil domain-containing protein 25-like n=1 Tax=Corticium candelabrum TaxID=121492 RepID=UPI002E269AFF|nr:coiled-coil domain-containing protein 25-like [Corticium candelabrum]
MVLYFTSNSTSPPVVIYTGEDKHVNEDLLKYGFPEDFWFHVDKLSSAHVYLRMPTRMGIDDIPEGVIMDCAQLVKANSIEGSKLSTTDVKYTPWSNLKKTGDMEVGQVGFHDNRLVRTITVKKNAEIIRRLNKTKKQLQPDLAAEREQRDRKERVKLRDEQRERKKKEKEEMDERKRQGELRKYSSLMQPEKMQSNEYKQNRSLAEIDDDFM